MDLPLLLQVLTEDKLREMMNDPRYFNPSQRDAGFVRMVDDGLKNVWQMKKKKVKKPIKY